MNIFQGAYLKLTMIHLPRDETVDFDYLITMET